MSKFYYKARTKEGKMETGTIEASTEQAAATLLQKYDIFVTSLKEENKTPSFLTTFASESRVPSKELAIFSRQLAIMLQSRVPVVQSLSSLASQTSNSGFKKTIQKISSLVEEGMSLAESFGRFPKTFNSFYVNLLKSGELSGKISETLYYISDYLETQHDIASQVQQAMVYPVLTLSVLFVVVNIVIVFLLPKIEELIQESSSSPPLFTVIMLQVYLFLEHQWWLMIAVLGLAIALVTFYFRTKEGKKIYDVLILKVPFLGGLLRKVFVARFCSNISTLISAGVSINSALKITSDTIDNSVYRNIIVQVETRVSEGEKMSSLLAQHKQYFPSFVVQMIKVGEETGRLEQTLKEIVNFYQKDIKKAIDLFLTLLEPIIIIILGIIVGMLAISVFVPLYSTLGTI